MQDLQAVRSMLSERVKEWTRDWKEQGIREGIREGMQKGREEGRQEGEALFLLRLLERRFGPVEEAVRERVRSADGDTLLIWGERVLIAKSLGEVFQD
ncbi:MAG: DUF4351 domain-containing protein [Methylococcales bacterium]